MYKYWVLQSLPGGKKNYLHFLVEILTNFQSNYFLRNDFFEYVNLKYSSTGKSATFYLNIFISFGLINETERGLVLSNVGNLFLSTKNIDMIVNILMDKYGGVTETMEFLKNNEYSDINEIAIMLIKKFNLNWKTNSSLRKMLIWLEALNIVRKDNNKLYLTDYGKKFI